MTPLEVLGAVLVLVALVVLLAGTAREVALDRPRRPPRSHPEDRGSRPPAAW